MYAYIFKFGNSSVLQRLQFRCLSQSRKVPWGPLTSLGATTDATQVAVSIFVLSQWAVMLAELIGHCQGQQGFTGQALYLRAIIRQRKMLLAACDAPVVGPRLIRGA